MWTLMPSPVGDVRVVERDDAIVAIEFAPFLPPRDGRPLGDRDDHHPVLANAVRQLRAYFDGELREFDARRALVLALSFVPPAVAGYTLERPIEGHLGGPTTIAVGLVAGGVAGVH